MHPGHESEMSFGIGNSVVPIPNHSLEEGKAPGLLMDMSPWP